MQPPGNPRVYGPGQNYQSPCRARSTASALSSTRAGNGLLRSVTSDRSLNVPPIQMRASAQSRERTPGGLAKPGGTSRARWQYRAYASCPSVLTRPLMPKVVRTPLRMAMISYAYSYVIDALNTAALNAEVRAPMRESWDGRAQPADTALVVGGVIGVAGRHGIGCSGCASAGLQGEKYSETAGGWSVGFGSVLHRAADGDLAELGQPGLGFAGRDLHAGPGQREAVGGGADDECRCPDRGRGGAGERGR